MLGVDEQLYRNNSQVDHMNILPIGIPKFSDKLQESRTSRKYQKQLQHQQSGNDEPKTKPFDTVNEKLKELQKLEQLDLRGKIQTKAPINSYGNTTNRSMSQKRDNYRLQFKLQKNNHSEDNESLCLS